MVGARIRSALVRQASQSRASFCNTCKRNACQRNLSPQCQECGFRTRIKIVNTTAHLTNVIKYLQRAEPDLQFEEALSQTTSEGLKTDSITPILLYNVQEGPPELPAQIPELPRAEDDMQWSAIRGGVKRKSCFEGSGKDDASSSTRADKKSHVSANLSDDGPKDAACQTPQLSNRLTKLCDAEVRLHEMDAEIIAIKQLLAGIHAEHVEKVDAQSKS